MKRIFSLIMALCLLFCGVLPVFATETGTGSAAVMDSDNITPFEPVPSEKIAPLSDFTGDGTEFYTKIQLTITDRNGNPIAGAVYGLYSSADDRFIEMLTTDENGVATSVDVPMETNYYLEEISTPEGFLPNAGRHEIKLTEVCAPSRIDTPILISISKQGVAMEIPVTNPMIFGDVQTIKASDDKPNERDLMGAVPLSGIVLGTVKVQKSGEDGALSGVEFDVYCTVTNEKVDSMVTDADGHASLNLPLGRYYLVETATAPGYALLTGRVNFTLAEDYETVTLSILNQKTQVGDDKGQIKVLKRDADGDTLLPGASFAICRVSDDSKVSEVVTGTDGTGMSQAILAGDYYLQELRAPSGFQISEEKHPVTVTEGETIEITIINKRLPEEPSEPDQSATLKLLKVDAVDSKTPLSGAVFGIYATEGGAKVGELLTDMAGSAAMTLPEGDYILRELEAPEGYKLSGDSVSLHLKAGDAKELTVKNSRSDPEKPESPTLAKPGTLKIVKVDSDDGKKLADAVFGVFYADTDKQIDTLTTNKSGIAELSLPVGGYYLRELEAPDGYTIKKTDVNFHLESGATRELTVKNTREDEPEKLGILELTKEDRDTGKALCGAVFVVYTKDNEKIDEVTTGRDGIAELELPVGSYYLRELEAPRGYQLDRGKVTFKITEDKTTRLIVENVKEKADPVKPETSKPEQQKPETPKPTPTPNPNSSQLETSKPSPSQPTPTEPSGKIRLVKLAAGSGAPLPSAVFGVYAQSGEKLSKIISGSDGTATLSLPVGRYYLKEQRAPYGYKPETARIRVDVLQNKTTLVEVTNELDPNAPSLPEINVPQTGIPFPVQSYALAALLFGIAALCGVQLIRSRKNTQ